ncbi:galectin-8 isoform X1 [Lissotriton helveticus]
MMEDGLQRTFQDPGVPFAMSIPGGLQAGHMVAIHGTVPDNADRFQVDFQCGSSIDPRADVAFHFNPRFKRSGCIVCNTLQHERWGREEITYQMPIKKGQPFEILVMVFNDKFQVAANGKHLLIYNHRINLDRVDTLGIYGMVKIDMIRLVTNTTLKGSQPQSLAGVKEEQSIELPMTSEFEIPYTGMLNKPMAPGRTIVIKGEVNKNANRFSIDLKPTGSNNIALHLNPRVKSRMFVRNSYINDSWGEEENKLEDFPFCSDMYFEIIILCEAQEYKVAVNGKHSLEYKHRFRHLDQINVLSINGDIRLLDVRSW